MLRVLIVDDEPLVRTGIRYRIPWGEYRMQVVAEAGSVQEAIAVLQGQEIDVVFTDIVMPGGNGLELLQWLRENHPFITSVVLSYYDEFSYIQDALRLGTADYIVKTELDSPYSIQFMKGIEEKALRNRQNHQKLQEPQSSREALSAVAVVGLEQKTLALRQEDMLAAKAHYPVSRNSWLLLYEGELGEDRLLDMEQQYGREGILLTFDRTDISTVDLILAVNLFLSWDFFYERLPNLSVYSVDAYSILGHSESLSGPRYVRVEEELSSMQWIWDAGRMEEMLETIRRSRLLPPVIYNLFYCVQIQWNHFFPQKDIPAMFPLTGIHWWYQWVEWLNNFRVFATTQSRLSSYSPEVVSAIQNLMLWIDQHFTEEITLTDASKQVSVSPNYLSRCFKDITGKRFNQYVRDQRIACSKKMLLQSRLPIRKIAELCGFQDQFYFNKVFKKAVGETPTSFRQSHRRDMQ